MMWMDWGSEWVTMWLTMALSLGGLALLIGIALRAEFAPWPRRPVDPRMTDPKDVLALRLARGDIDTAEYLDRINALAEVRDA